MDDWLGVVCQWGVVQLSSRPVQRRYPFNNLGLRACIVLNILGHLYFWLLVILIRDNPNLENIPGN